MVTLEKEGRMNGTNDIPDNFDISTLTPINVSLAWTDLSTKNALISRPVFKRCRDCKHLGEESKERRDYYRCSVKELDMRPHYYCDSWERREE